MEALTSTVLFSPMMGHSYLPVYDGFRLQNVLIMAIGQCLLFGLCAVMLWPAAVATGPIDLGEDGSFVEQSQISLKVKVSVQVLIAPVSEALVIPRPHLSSSASIPYTIFFWHGLGNPSAVR